MIERDPTASLPVPTSPGLPVKTSGSTALAVYKTGALAAGAIAIGALAIGALAIGRIAVGDLMLRRGRVRGAEVGLLIVEELTVGRFRLGPLEREPSAAPER